MFLSWTQVHKHFYMTFCWVNNYTELPREVSRYNWLGSHYYKLFHLISQSCLVIWIQSEVMTLILFFHVLSNSVPGEAVCRSQCDWTWVNGAWSFGFREKVNNAGWRFVVGFGHLLTKRVMEAGVRGLGMMRVMGCGGMSLLAKCWQTCTSSLLIEAECEHLFILRPLSFASLFSTLTKHLSIINTGIWWLSVG